MWTGIFHIYIRSLVDRNTEILARASYLVREKSTKSRFVPPVPSSTQNAQFVYIFWIKFPNKTSYVVLAYQLHQLYNILFIIKFFIYQKG